MRREIAPRQGPRTERPGDLDRLGQRLLVVEQRQHQRPVVAPADGRRRHRPRRASRGAASPRAARHSGSSTSTSIPATAAHALARIVAQFAGPPRDRSPPARRRTARPASTRRSSAPTRSPARATGTIRWARRRDRPASARSASHVGGVRVAAADGELGQDRPREQLRHRHAPRDLALSGALGLVPLAGAKAQPGDHRREHTARACAPRAPGRTRAPARRTGAPRSGRTQHISE